jgi:hypothetical protein
MSQAPTDDGDDVTPRATDHSLVRQATVPVALAEALDVSDGRVTVDRYESTGHYRVTFHGGYVNLNVAGSPVEVCDVTAWRASRFQATVEVTR